MNYPSFFLQLEILCCGQFCPDCPTSVPQGHGRQYVQFEWTLPTTGVHWNPGPGLLWQFQSARQVKGGRGRDDFPRQRPGQCELPGTRAKAISEGCPMCDTVQTALDHATSLTIASGVFMKSVQPVAARGTQMARGRSRRTMLDWQFCSRVSNGRSLI